MAQFSCNECGHVGHYSEFKEDGDDAGGDDPDYEPDLECPSCGSRSVGED